LLVARAGYGRIRGTLLNKLNKSDEGSKDTKIEVQKDGNIHQAEQG
jgi:hypothetical protein